MNCLCFSLARVPLSVGTGGGGHPGPKSAVSRRNTGLCPFKPVMCSFQTSAPSSITPVSIMGTSLSST